MTQARISRYQVLTRLRFDPRSDPRPDPRRKPPQIFDANLVHMAADELRDIIPTIIQPMKQVLHCSILLFVIGLVILPHTFGDKKTFIVAITFFGLGVFCFVVTTGPLPSERLAGRGPVIEERASTWRWILNARSVSWLFDSLTGEEEIERFLIGIPGFYKSTHVEDPAKALQQANAERSPKAILAFMDRSLSSDLPEETRRRRIKVSLEAMQTHPYLLQRSFYHALQACSTESAFFKSVDFPLLADQHSNDDDVKTRSLARCIITIAINRLQDYHTDMRSVAWAGIIQRRLNWPEDLFHWEHRDSIKLRNLIQLTRELDTLRLDYETFSPKLLCHLLQEACKLNVRNAAPKLQDDFCDLWNELVIAMQLQDQDPTILTNIKLTLSRIRAVHVSLHQGTESQLPPPANATNVDPDLQNLSSYSPCTVRHLPVASTNPGSNMSLALNSGVA